MSGKHVSVARFVISPRHLLTTGVVCVMHVVVALDISVMTTGKSTLPLLFQVIATLKAASTLPLILHLFHWIAFCNF